MRRRIFRVFLIAYPVVAGVIYLLLALGPSRRVAELERELQSLERSEIIAREALQIQHHTHRQSAAIQQIMNQLHRRAGNVSISFAPGYLAQMASENGLRPEQISLATRTNQNGWGFSVYRVTTAGPYENQVAFLQAMEHDSERFVQITRASLSGSPTASETSTMEAEVKILLQAPHLPGEEPGQKTSN